MPGLNEHLAQARAAQQRHGIRRGLAAPPSPGMIDLASNDYLGLARDPRVVAAASEALHRFGTGSGGSRVVAGNLAPHADLDDALAALVGTPAVLSVASGYAANLAAITALTAADGCVILDAHAHASLVDGARLSQAPVWWAEHNDPDDVARLLARHGRPGALVVVESIYSALGDAAPLGALAEVADRHGATLVVDEAHALGVVGPEARPGAGGAAASGIEGCEHVVLTGALGKACASQGGFIAASRAVIEHLISTGRTVIYDTAASPAAAAAAATAARLILAHPGLVASVRDRAGALAAALRRPVPAGAIVSVPIDPRGADELAARAADVGIRLGVFRPGSTPDGRHRLRITAHAGLTDDELTHVRPFLNSVHLE